MKIHEYNEMMAYLMRPEPRQNFDNGGSADTSPVYNEKTGHIYKKGNRYKQVYSKTPPKNQFTAVRPLRSLAELQKVIDEAPLIKINGKFFEQNPEDLAGDSEYSSKELISRKELDKKGPDGVRNRDKLKFKSTGKKRIEEVNQGNINRREKIKAAQGSEISIIGGKKINKAFGHVYPIIESAKPGTKTTTVIDADMNNKLIGYNIIGQKIAEDQEYLLKVKPEGYKKEIIINNAKAKKNVMNAIQDLGKKYKGQIGYFQVDPETGVFKPKAGNYKMSFAGLEGEDKIYKDMTFKERKVFGKKISDIEKLKTIPGITTADKIPVPEKSTTKSKILSGIGKGAKIVGKVIKPVGVGFGINAVKTAIIKADEQGLDLSNLDKAMAFDSGDADVALNNARRRVDPEFAAQERAKDLAQMTDDFEEVGLDDIGMQDYTEDYKI
jgi:translation elongation factor EF-1beta